MYEYENEHRPVENQQSYAYNFSPEPPVHQPEQHPQKKRGGAGKVVPFGQSGFPQDCPFPAMAAIEQKPRRFVDDFTEPGEAYPVRATDIDVGRHVNNLAYVRATLGCCTAEELTRVQTFEIHYASPCLEGETLRLSRCDDGAETRLAVKKENGKAAALAALTFRT